MTITPFDADQVFIESYLKLEGRDDAPAITAYRRAGYFDPAYPVAVAAERTLRRLSDKIEFARSKFSSLIKTERSRESVLSDIDAVFQSALADKDHSAAINAKRLEAQLQGLLQENVTVTHRMEISQFTDEQLLKIINSKSPLVEGVEFTEVPIKGIGHMKPPNDKSMDTKPSS